MHTDIKPTKGQADLEGHEQAGTRTKTLAQTQPLACLHLQMCMLYPSGSVLCQEATPRGRLALKRDPETQLWESTEETLTKRGTSHCIDRIFEVFLISYHNGTYGGQKADIPSAWAPLCLLAEW